LVARIPDAATAIPCFSADSRTLFAVMVSRRELLVCDCRTGRTLREVTLGKHRKSNGCISGAVFSPDRKSVGLIRYEEGEATAPLEVYSLPDGGKVREVPLGEGEFPEAFAPDGKSIATWEHAGVARLRDAITGKLRHTLPGKAEFGVTAAFSPDGKALLVCRREQAWTVWDVRTGKRALAGEGKEDEPRAAQYSPDGKTFLLVNGKSVRVFDGHRAAVSSLTFAPDGRSFASGGEDCTAVVWDLFALPFGGDKLTVEQAVKAWRGLASRDTSAAFGAMRQLAGDPRRALEALGPRLRKFPAPVTAKRLARLIADLDADDFDVREDAQAELSRLGTDAEKALRQARATKPSPEMALRLDKLLASVRPSPEALQAIRAVAVLEYAGTKEALGLLRKLARDAEHPALKREAKVAIARLSR
jgi:WD40 repeat protein